jgi:ribonuclease HII
MDLGKLSIEEIHDRYLNHHHAVSPRLLNQLKRDTRAGVRKLYPILKRRYDKERGERLRLDAMLNFERVLWRSGLTRVAGVDEVGMGPLAGPVVAAAVVFAPHTEIDGIDDSKRLEPERREQLEIEIREKAAGIGIGVSEVHEIDTCNIYQAGLLAMRRAIEALPVAPEHVLTDARTIPNLTAPQNAFHKGDGIDFSIAAASIIAKTYRDRLMEKLDCEYTGYGFARHKGYCTAEHQRAIRALGPCPIHRMSFQFIRELCGEFSPTFYALKHTLACSGSAGELKLFEQEFELRGGELGENEQRKLKLMLLRRWKVLA